MNDGRFGNDNEKKKKVDKGLHKVDTKCWLATCLRVVQIFFSSRNVRQRTRPKVSRHLNEENNIYLNEVVAVVAIWTGGNINKTNVVLQKNTQKKRITRI